MPSHVGIVYGTQTEAWLSARSGEVAEMRHYLGVGLQFFVLTALPLLIWWQLQFGFALVWMPTLLTLGIVIFWIGTRLRET